VLFFSDDASLLNESDATLEFYSDPKYSARIARLTGGNWSPIIVHRYGEGSKRSGRSIRARMARPLTPPPPPPPTAHTVVVPAHVCICHVLISIHSMDKCTGCWEQSTKQAGWEG
jgi:hypothetical protein